MKEIVTDTDMEEGMKFFETLNEFNIVILDLKMPVFNCFECIEKMKTKSPETPLISNKKIKI
jgi:YesN/AraC family two-component response regulator